MSGEKLKADILAYARSLGFERAGVTSAASLGSAEKSLGDWLESGCAGEMDYMQKNWKTRARPEELLAGAKSVITLAMSYYNGDPLVPSPLMGEGEDGDEATPHFHPPPQGGRKLKRARIARYAWGKDYHRVIQKRLEALVRYIEALAPDTRCKTYVDTGPLLERALAQKAGVGFVGKNTMLITRGLGSWVFLASVLTTLKLPEDSPDMRSCGSCTLCIDACPTQALTEPYHLDARRCIAYLTIELKGEIPEEMRTQTGDWLFGCDICQEVCPHNTCPLPTPVTEFRASPASQIELTEVLSLKTETEFEKRFAGTPLKRSKRHGLLRNACLVAANQNRTDLLPQLETLAAQDSHPVVREHAAWAVQQLNKSN